MPNSVVLPNEDGVDDARTPAAVRGSTGDDEDEARPGVDSGLKTAGLVTR
jgi:hypothetical protein